MYICATRLCACVPVCCSTAVRSILDPWASGLQESAVSGRDEDTTGTVAAMYLHHWKGVIRSRLALPSKYVWGCGLSCWPVIACGGNIHVLVVVWAWAGAATMV